MKEIYLLRTAETDDSTFGHFIDPISASLHLVSLELPQKNNEQNISCILAGSYICRYENHKTKGECYRIIDVPNRDGILIHILNFSSETQGCIGVGKTMVYPTMINSSKVALAELIKYCGKEFRLTIKDILNKE